MQFKHDRNQLTVPANLCLQATDPDAGETEALQYSLVEPSNLFAVEPSSGQVYVVSAAGESGKVTLKVKAEDPHGLYATATVEVCVCVHVCVCECVFASVSVRGGLFCFPFLLPW